jgi:hypothetical protein
MMPLLLAIVLIIVTAVGLRSFFLTTRWRLSEFMFVMIVISMITGLIFRSFSESGELTGASALVMACAASACAMFPVLVAAWWALHTAERLEVEKTWQRIGLILLGLLFLPALLAVPFTVLTLFFVLVLGREPMAWFLPMWLLTTAIAPGLWLEHRCRVNTRAKREARYRERRRK